MEEAIGTPHIEVSLPGTLPPSDEFVKVAEYVYQGAIIAVVLLLLLTAAL